ncbi:MAG: Ig-like domain-containing protein [Acidobacteria bacterium]|nr:Ig-like domain-containing protein [Acidobacteriota bacterium]
MIPNGSCSWTSGIATTKQITIRAQNYTPTSGGNTTRSVTITNNAGSSPLFSLTTGNNFHIGLAGIRINEGSGTGNHLRVSGSGSKVALINDMFFEVKQRNGNSLDISVVSWSAQGGVMWNTRFLGIGTGGTGVVGPDGASFVIKGQPRVWNTASTMGTLDTDGTINLYVEDSSCFNVGQFPDADDHARAVFRHSTIDGCSGLTHGFTSTWGGRHVEWYNDVFSVTEGERNHSGRYFWIRAGTIVFTDNVVNNASNPGAYGSPSSFSIGDNTSPGSYPQARQPGWGHNGTSNISDPIYSWNNTGARAYSFGFQNGWDSIVQVNRDVFVNNGAKPGYTKYPYPHPLRSGAPPSDTTPPTTSITAPTAGATVSGTVTVSANASDNVGVTSVAFRVDGTTLVTDTTSSYSMSWNTTSASEGSHALTAIASDAAGNTTTSGTVTVTVDNVPASDTSAPSTPANLAATAISSTQINLSWTASTDNVEVTGYRVERCTGSSCTNFTQVGTPTGTTYNDTGLTGSTLYRYRARATDAAGNLSPYSSIASTTTQSGGSGPAPLPTGNNGIAAGYPGDANIASNANVLFADGFESYSTASQLTNNWNEAYHLEHTRIATEAGNVFAGSRALEFKLPQQSTEVANSAVKYINPTEDTIFLRAYTKFEAGYNIIGSSHNGLVIQAQYCCPGVPANGTNKFFVDIENSREVSSETTPGMTNTYIYHPDQRDIWGDHWYPDGRVVPFDLIPGDFGPYFVPRPNFTPELNRWYSYELMVKANTPGQRDGRIAWWIDGNLIADFQNVRLRDVSSLKIDQIVLGLHGTGSTARENKKWYDNVVVARSYIGPMVSSAPSQPLEAPTGLRIVP